MYDRHDCNLSFSFPAYGERLPCTMVLSQDMMSYLSSDLAWNPSESYFYDRVGRLVNDILWLLACPGATRVK